MFYSTEEAERERHRQALARARRSRERDLHGSGSIVGAASSVLRSLSSECRLCCCFQLLIELIAQLCTIQNTVELIY